MFKTAGVFQEFQEYSVKPQDWRFVQNFMYLDARWFWQAPESDPDSGDLETVPSPYVKERSVHIIRCSNIRHSRG